MNSTLSNRCPSGSGAACVVSVIIPTYNRSRLVAQAIRTALAQTFDDIEVIVMDDGSTDDTREVVQSIGDDRIRYIWQENQQRCVARNNGIEQARGKFIALLDSDDLWFPDKLAVQVDAFERHPEVGVVFSSCARVNSKIEFPFAQDFLQAETGEWVGNLHSELLLGNRLASPTVVVRRELFERAGGFDAALPHAEDWDMWIRLSRICDFCKVPQPLAGYRVHDDNRTSNPLSTMRGDSIIMDKHLGPLSGCADQETRLRAEMVAYVRHGIDALALGIAEGEAWLCEAQHRATQLGDPAAVAPLIFGNAFSRAAYSAKDRHREAGLAERSAAVAASCGAPLLPAECVRMYWETWAHACYQLRDFAATISCARQVARCCGYFGLDRGLRSITARSLFRLRVGRHRGRIRFAIEQELPAVLGLLAIEEAAA